MRQDKFSWIRRFKSIAAAAGGSSILDAYCACTTTAAAAESKRVAADSSPYLVARRREGSREEGNGFEFQFQGINCAPSSSRRRRLNLTTSAGEKRFYTLEFTLSLSVFSSRFVVVARTHTQKFKSSQTNFFLSLSFA